MFIPVRLRKAKSKSVDPYSRMGESLLDKDHQIPYIIF